MVVIWQGGGGGGTQVLVSDYDFIQTRLNGFGR